MPLTETEIAKIRQEADEFIKPYKMEGNKILEKAKSLIIDTYIVVAIKERERANVLVDAAKDVCEKIKPLLPESILSSIYKTLSKALKQYNP